MEWWLWGREWERVGDALVGLGVVCTGLGLTVRRLARRPPPPDHDEAAAWARGAQREQGR